MQQTSEFRPLDPQILAQLASLRGRIRRLSMMHGLGLFCLAFASVFLASFYFDRWLNPPHGMRLVVAPLMLGGLGAALWWWVIRPSRVPLSDVDAAMLVERVHPELRDRLVSALQLARNAGNASPELVEQAIRSGEEASRAIRFSDAVRPKPALLRAVGGVAALACLVVVAAMQSEDFGVFLQRFAGGRVEWPQRTHLDIEIPTLASTVRVQRAGDLIQVKISRGADMAVRVKAVGEIPPLVELVDSNGKRTPMALAPPNEYQARYHAVREPFEFHAEGGDDRSGLPRVVVQTVVPPSIAKVQVAVRPPEYSKMTPYSRDGGSFEALAGSIAEIRVETTSPVKRGVLRYRDSDEEVQLQMSPAAPNETPSLSTRVTVERNRRYTIEVEDAEGLRNPESGSYSIVALADRAPEAKLLAPGRTEVEVTPDGAIAIYARVSDDFGVAAARLRWRAGNSPALESIPLALTSLDAEAKAPAASMPASAPARAPKQGVVRAKIDIASLRVKDLKDGVERPLKEGDAFEFYVEALDERAPAPGSGESPHVRAVVSSGAEILKRITERLTRAKDTVHAILTLQTERKRRVGEVEMALAGSDGSPTADRPSITSVMVGQNRVTTDARTLAHEFFEATESIAGNKLDRISDAVFGALDRLRSEIPAAVEDPYHGDVAAAIVAAVRSGTLGSPVILGKFTDMLAEATQIASKSSPAAVKSLDSAALATTSKNAIDALQQAQKHQDDVVQSLEHLLGLLSEWDNFQAVITATRELYDQQKSLHLRTKEEAKASAK